MTRESTLAPPYGVLRVQPPQVTERYCHRNGETEHPTQPGFYWFDGELVFPWIDLYRGDRIPEFDEEMACMVLRNPRPRTVIEVPPGWREGTGQLRGRWHGPIVGPFSEVTP